MFLLILHIVHCLITFNFPFFASNQPNLFIQKRIFLHKQTLVHNTLTEKPSSNVEVFSVYHRSFWLYFEWVHILLVYFFFFRTKAICFYVTNSRYNVETVARAFFGRTIYFKRIRLLWIAYRQFVMWTLANERYS